MNYRKNKVCEERHCQKEVVKRLHRRTVKLTSKSLCQGALVRALSSNIPRKMLAKERAIFKLVPIAVP